MRVPRLLVALAVAGALLSPALAHRPMPVPPSSPFVPGIREVVQDLAGPEIIQLTSDRLTKSVRWGRYVRYGGALVIGASLVLTALDWFYNEAQKSTGTSLDDWFRFSPAWDYCYYVTGGYMDCVAGGISKRVAHLKWELKYYDVCNSTYVYYTRRDGDTVYFPGFAVVNGNWGDSQIEAWFAQNAYGPGCGVDRAPLPDWIQSHPDAADGVKQVVTDYIGDQDAQGNIPQTFAEPLPGLTLDPAPTGNQWYDNPFFNPYEDTDGDGWPDWFEWDTGSDPSNAGSQPLPNGDPDGDGYDNAAERDAGTDPTDPSSRPGVDQDQDTDGDGLKDSADPCPNDPNNMCQPEEEENPDEIPDPTEPTLTPVDLPQLEPPELPDPTGRFDQIRTNFEQNLQNLWDTLQDRFPVGMARWIPAPPSVSGGSCDMQFQLEIPDLPPANIDICNNPVMQWAASTGRRIVLASLMVGFLFAIARRASHA